MIQLRIMGTKIYKIYLQSGVQYDGPNGYLSFTIPSKEKLSEWTQFAPFWWII